MYRLRSTPPHESESGGLPRPRPTASRLPLRYQELDRLCPPRARHRVRKAWLCPQRDKLRAVPCFAHPRVIVDPRPPHMGYAHPRSAEGDLRHCLFCPALYYHANQFETGEAIRVERFLDYPVSLCMITMSCSSRLTCSSASYASLPFSSPCATTRRTLVHGYTRLLRCMGLTY
jgi:hypothetical protein